MASATVSAVTVRQVITRSAGHCDSPTSRPTLSQSSARPSGASCSRTWATSPTMGIGWMLVSGCWMQPRPFQDYANASGRLKEKGSRSTLSGREPSDKETFYGTRTLEGTVRGGGAIGQAMGKLAVLDGGDCSDLLLGGRA